ncbi:hypothetical protein ACHAWT_003145 [Skeletonema menzelii]
MTPKPLACRDMSSSISIREVSTHDEKMATNNDCGDVDEKKDSFHDDISKIKKAVVAGDDEAEVASSTNHRQMLEHSFSYNDLSHFNIDEMKSQPKRYPEMKGLRADLVHLHGLSLHAAPKAFDAQLLQHALSFHARPLRRALTMSDAKEEGEESRTTKTVVVIPSIDLDKKELTRMCCDQVEFYEERQLFHLLMAGDPSVRIIYLTSRPVDESVVKYYLSLSHDEDIDAAHYQSNLFCDVHNMLPRVIMIHVPSTECISLSDKILRQKKLITLLQELIRSSFGGKVLEWNDNTVGMSVFTGSDSVDELSHKLGAKLLEASGESLHFGTKQGSREIFAACGISHPAGTPSLEDEDLLTYGDASEHGGKVYWAYNHRYIRSAHNLAVGIARKIVRGIRPKRWIVKLNQGFSGKGNASIDLQHIQRRFAGCKAGDNEATLRIAEEIEKEFAISLKCEDPKMTWFDVDEPEQVGFQTQIKRLGVIAEVFIEGEVPTSPSIQAVIEGKDVSIVSTHEQVLDGQVYSGCKNPCNSAYRASIMDAGLKVGKFLAAHGVRGHFAVDFLASEQPKTGSWNVHAVEVNLRQGGTTHPHCCMALLCGGSICSDGLFRTNEGELRCYVATDCHYSENLKGCTEKSLINALENSSSDPAAYKIRWNKADRIGVVFHLFKFISTGRIGFTAIGRNVEESQALYTDTVTFLERFHGC